MQRQSVTGSSNIASVGYDADTQTMEVEFLKGQVYQYEDVPEQVYNDMLESSSPGSYLRNNVINVYSSIKI